MSITTLLIAGLILRKYCLNYKICFSSLWVNIHRHEQTRTHLDDLQNVSSCINADCFISSYIKAGAKILYTVSQNSTMSTRVWTYSWLLEKKIIFIIFEITKQNLSQIDIPYDIFTYHDHIFSNILDFFCIDKRSSTAIHQYP